MTLTDPIGDLLTRMRNAQHGRHTECRAPWSTLKENLCQLLLKNGYLAHVTTDGEGVQKNIVVSFRSDRGPLTLTRVSKPGSRKYAGAADIRSTLHGNELAIVSTSLGLLTNAEAKEKNIGGEVLCTIS